MKAIVKIRKEKGLELKEMEVPRPGKGEVLVEIKAAAICGFGATLRIVHFHAYKLMLTLIIAHSRMQHSSML